MFGERLTHWISKRRLKAGKAIGLLTALFLVACGDLTASGHITPSKGDILELSGTYSIESISTAAFKLTIDLIQVNFTCKATSPMSKVPSATHVEAYSLLMKISCSFFR
ncbi:MAG TPA: hypothetical protein EYQ00_02530 [Dehalococcoidia bacterium]|nr:hypothetical protein [Dehalococcoidia bacterium]